MKNILLILLLLSNAVLSDKAESILYSRTVILCLLFIVLFLISNLYISPLINTIGIYNGLFNVTITSHTLNIFIYFVSAMILTLTGFYPRKLHVKEFSSLSDIFSKKLIYNKIVISILFHFWPSYVYLGIPTTVIVLVTILHQ